MEVKTGIRHILLTLAILFLSNTTLWAQEPTEECLALGILEQIGCFSDLAAKEEDASACDAAEHEGVRYQCYAVAAEKLGDWKACLEIPPKSREHMDLRDVCISDVAEKDENPALCGKIESRNFRDSCFLKVYRRTGDSSLCGRISDPRIKSSCTGEPVIVE